VSRAHTRDAARITEGVASQEGRRTTSRSQSHLGETPPIERILRSRARSLRSHEPACGDRSSSFPAGAKPWQVAIDNLNSDGNPDLIVIPYQRDITHPAENAVSILLGDGHGGFHPMSGSPLPLAGCRGPNKVAAGDLTGDGTQSIVVACAESRTMLIYHRVAAGKYTIRQRHSDARCVDSTS
jgi:hypothetical protein